MPGPIHTQHWEAPPGRWSFSASEPAAALTGLVTQYWEVRGELAPFSERVLPNGALEVMVNLGPIHHLVDGDVRTRWDHAWLSGLHERAIAIESADGTHLVSARLTPLGASTLLGPAAAAAVNRVVALTEVLGQAANPLVDALRAAPDAATRFQLLEECLLGFLPPAVPVPPFVVAALERLEAEHGRLRITELHAGLGVSRKHLTVCFTQAVGIAPKRYAAIRRFAWTLARLQASESVDWARLAAEAGYADQAHLVRDFRRVAAASPTEFLRIRSPDGTALLDEAR